jgi:hypothetical protein
MRSKTYAGTSHTIPDLKLRNFFPDARHDACGAVAKRLRSRELIAHRTERMEQPLAPDFGYHGFDEIRSLPRLLHQTFADKFDGRPFSARTNQRPNGTYQHASTLQRGDGHISNERTARLSIL